MNIGEALRRIRVASVSCYGCGHEHNCGVRCGGGCVIVRAAREQLANSAPVVHGQWIPIGDMAECSECGECVTDSGEDGTEKFRPFQRFYKFCPSRGARMDGGERECRS